MFLFLAASSHAAFSTELLASLDTAKQGVFETQTPVVQIAIFMTDVFDARLLQALGSHKYWTNGETGFCDFAAPSTAYLLVSDPIRAIYQGPVLITDHEVLPRGDVRVFNSSKLKGARIEFIRLNMKKMQWSATQSGWPSMLTLDYSATWEVWGVSTNEAPAKVSIHSPCKGTVTVAWTGPNYMFLQKSSDLVNWGNAYPQGDLHCINFKTTSQPIFFRSFIAAGLPIAPAPVSTNSNSDKDFLPSRR